MGAFFLKIFSSVIIKKVYLEVTLFITQHRVTGVGPPQKVTNLMGTKCKHDISNVTSQVTPPAERNVKATIFTTVRDPPIAQ